MVCSAMYTGGSLTGLTLIFGNGAAAGGLATTIAADGLISTATLLTAVTFLAAVNERKFLLPMAAVVWFEEAHHDR